MRFYFRRLIYFFLFIIIIFNYFSFISNCNPAIDWKKTYGGEEYDVSTAIIQTKNDGYILGGITRSFGSGKNDFWLIKINNNGSVKWNKLYGGTGEDSLYDVIQLNDGCFILTGASNSSFINGTNYDFLLIKTKQNGTIEWYKSYDILGDDQSTSIIETNNSLMILGISKDIDNEYYDSSLIKTDKNGSIKWKKTYGGNKDEMSWALIETSDGGFALAGYTSSFGSGHYDSWLVRTDSDGNELWNRTYGGKGDDGCNSLVETSDGGFALAGYT